MCMITYKMYINKLNIAALCIIMLALIINKTSLLQLLTVLYSFYSLYNTILLTTILIYCMFLIN